MKTRTMVQFLLLALVVLTPAAAQQDQTIEGEVLQVRERVRLQDGTACSEVTLRTKDGDRLRVRLGEPGSCTGCVGEGDQVRLQVMGGGPIDGAYLAREMRVQRTGESFNFRNEAGALVRTRQRSPSDAAGAVSEPGSARQRDRRPAAAPPSPAPGGARRGPGRMGGGAGSRR